ncbi:MAG: large-conductance mechanosensitive channel protein MscL [Clostridiales bacterium]|nr:large-conductance mechanosensitive channel protein MscL [Clostridiales bacterium]
MKKFFADFKAFINKGNVIDMAVGVVIATAFGKITSSLVADIIMPLIGLATGSASFADMKLTLREPVLNELGEVITEGSYLKYGNFIQMILDFVIIALCVFIFIRILTKSAEKAKALSKKNKEEEKEEEKEPEPSAEEKLLTEIRDILKKDNE